MPPGVSSLGLAVRFGADSLPTPKPQETPTPARGSLNLIGAAAQQLEGVRGGTKGIRDHLAASERDRGRYMCGLLPE